MRFLSTSRRLVQSDDRQRSTSKWTIGTDACGAHSHRALPAIAMRSACTREVALRASSRLPTEAPTEPLNGPTPVPSHKANQLRRTLRSKSNGPS